MSTGIVFGFILGIYLCVLGILSRVKTMNFSGKGIFLFRAFFPSWKFFEDFSDVPELYYRLGPSRDSLGHWQLCLPKSKRSLSTLFFNSEGNYLHACRNHLHHLITDINEVDEEKPDEFEKSVSFQLTKNLVLFEIKRSKQKGKHFQFKVSTLGKSAERKGERPCETSQTLLISRDYEYDG